MAPIIRTCSVAALALALSPAPAAARPNTASALADYVTARMLDGQESGQAAAQAYSLALSGAPDNDRIATRAYREAIESGDKALALRAAHALDAQSKLPQDARLLLFGESLSKGDWRAARLMLDRLEEAGGFDFLAPALRAWTDVAAREADDVLSWLPARITGVALALVAGARLSDLRVQARRTPSPNSGWPMAAMALGLGVCLHKPG